MFTKIFNQRFTLIIALVLSIAAWCWSFANNYVLTYNDAASHLNIARRIVDNFTPGLAQIGTVWLPLPHLLMLIFAWNDTLWKTAFAGSIVSMASYVVSVVFTYKTINILTNKKIGAILGALVVALNPNFLYIQTTPMTESLTLATFILSIYFLSRYLLNRNTIYLVLTGVFVMLATLCRYDGWFLFISLCFLIPIAGIVNYGFKRAEAELFLFATSGGLGIGLWLLWNWTIFGDPLYFILGPYSAYAQQKILKNVGQLPTQGNIYNAVYYFIWSVIDNIGLLITAVGLSSILAVPFTLKKKTHIIIILAALSPLVFNILSLYIGQSAMNIPQAPTNPGIFNIRYGLMLLPSMALILGLVASRFRITTLLFSLIIIAQSIIFFQGGYPISLTDGLKGLQNTYYTVEASKWLADNYKGGLILTSLASHDAFVARAHIPMKNYIHEGNGKYWLQALQAPSKTIEYIALLKFPPDQVYKKLKNNADFKNNYVIVHTYKEFEIYQKKN